MKTHTIKNGSRKVIISEDAGKFSARLYVNGGDTATLLTWNGKTLKGAEKWAGKVLA